MLECPLLGQPGVAGDRPLGRDVPPCVATRAGWRCRRDEGLLALRFVSSVGAPVDQYNTDSARIKAFRPDGFRVGLSILKLGTVEVCSMEVGAAQIRTPQVGILQFGLKMGLAKVGSGKVCVRQLGLTQIGVLQIGAL